MNQYFTRCFYLDPADKYMLKIDLNRFDWPKIQWNEIFLKMPEHLPIKTDHNDEANKFAIETEKEDDFRPDLTKFRKYIVNRPLEMANKKKRFDEDDHDKLIYPFYDETIFSMEKVFGYDRMYDKYADLVKKFRDPEEQDVEELVKPHKVLNILMDVAEIMVEANALKEMREDPCNPLDMTLTTYNHREDELLYLGRLNLLSIIRYDKIQPINKLMKEKYNVKIIYFVRGIVSSIIIKLHDRYSEEKF